MDFEWDADKAEENLRKHKVSFAEEAETFSDPHGFALSDRKHSTVEERYYWVGMSESGRILTTRYTKRRGKIGIVGSGEWREFRKVYYEKTKR
jgi:uncharacterized DUF497 family protein